MHIYSVDRTRVPNTSLKITQRLGKTLLRDIPAFTTPTIDKAAGKLVICIDEVDTAITVRVREENPEIVATEVQFDRGVGTQWIWLRKMLWGFAESGSHPGLSAMPDKLQAKANLEHVRARAKRARKLHERLFGAHGTHFVRSSFVDQAESMAALLRLIKEDDLAKDIDAVVGPGYVDMLVACQEHYEDMVSTRMSRQQGGKDNFRELRAKLRWRVDRYKNAIETLLDDDEPETFELVDKALRSLTLLRERMSRAGGNYDEELLGEGLVELDELADLIDESDGAAIEEGDDAFEDDEPEAEEG